MMTGAQPEGRVLQVVPFRARERSLKAVLFQLPVERSFSSARRAWAWACAAK
jgi:hypothetical protein